MDRTWVFVRIKLITKSKAVFTYWKPQPHNGSAGQFLIYCPLKWDGLFSENLPWIRSAVWWLHQLQLHFSAFTTRDWTQDRQTWNWRINKNKICGKCSLRATLTNQGEWNVCRYRSATCLTQDDRWVKVWFTSIYGTEN